MLIFFLQIKGQMGFQRYGKWKAEKAEMAEKAEE